MKACDAVKMQDNSRGNGRRTGPAAVGLVSRRLEGLWTAPVVLLTAIIFVSPAQAQPLPATPCDTGRELITIPEVTRKDGKLKAVVRLSDEVRNMWVRKPGESFANNKGRCLPQRLRYLQGWNVTDWNAPDPPPPTISVIGDPIPGPTLRARIGDLIQISFRNQVDTKNFPTSLDQGDCDAATGTLPDPDGKTIKVNVYPRNNKMPNCVHGSSTSNLHFHGTHTTPSTTGDNVLLYIRPALRRVEGQPPIQPTDAVVKSNFDTIFKACEAEGSPKKWEDLPLAWRDEQKRLLDKYDETAPYHGKNRSLPPDLHLWPKNDKAIQGGKWPQYSVGAFPYCFRLPDKDAPPSKLTPAVKMGQAPGTHWYHAHVHGSTALNVANGLAGAFIIEGPYDDKLRAFYKEKNPDPGLEEKVLVIQQLATSLNLLSATRLGPPFLSVNGRRVPVITMQPGQVQMWRIVNAAYRSFVQFRNFAPPADVTETVKWRQTAQDGVQFHWDTYQTVGTENAMFNMAGGNRVDLLVKAPSKEGSYSLTVWESTSEIPGPPEFGTRTRTRAVTLLTVKVEGTAIDPAMVFIDEKSFPTFPKFLEKIPASTNTKTVTYDTTPDVPTPRPPEKSYMRRPLTDPDSTDPVAVLPKHTIDGELFHDEIKQRMVLDTVEEWTVVNKAVGIAHPFHIHVNPFQVVELFDPNSAKAKDPGDCYADPKDPTTWDPTKRKPACTALPEPFVWWDIRAIPAASNRDWDWKAPTQVCDEILPATDPKKYKCPSAAEGEVCRLNETAKQQQCTVALPSPVKIPGYFKMRSRFVDFAGVFVQHCHILAHEDVGMMQFVEVYDLRKGPTKGTMGLRHY